MDDLFLFVLGLLGLTVLLAIGCIFEYLMEKFND